MCVCPCVRLESSLLGAGSSSVSWELGVDKGESLELVLVQVLNHFLIGRRQHRRVACEKAVKVLRIPSTLLRRAEEEGEGWSMGKKRGAGGGWMDEGEEEEEEEENKRRGVAGRTRV